MIDLKNSNKLYFSIKEVATHFNVNESLLRFWEKEFNEIKPRKTEGGARQYTKEDIKTISVIHHLVKEKGLTLEGARLTLKNNKDDETKKLEVINRLKSIKKELLDLKKELE